MLCSYQGPHDAVRIDAANVVAHRGVPVEIPDEIAGTAPTGKPGTDRHRPGAGLLATAHWIPVRSDRPDPELVTAAGLVAWAAADPAGRVKAAVDIERARPNVRTSVVTALEALLTSESSAEADSSSPTPAEPAAEPEEA